MALHPSTPPDLADLYLAFRQAKIGLFYERRGVGLAALAAFEDDLPGNLTRLRDKLHAGDGWFGGLPLGNIWVVPKRIRASDSVERNQVIRIGTRTSDDAHDGLDIQLRCTPTPEFATLETLFLWRYGPLLQQCLSRHVLGYRLDLRQGELKRDGRWLYEYWPRQYERFRRHPVAAARMELAREDGAVVVLGADFASYYDTVDPSFLVSPHFIDSLRFDEDGVRTRAEYLRAATSLLGAYAGFRKRARKITGLEWNAGVPIGPLTSRLVANVALAPFDQLIANNPRVLCYRRYVDDVIVVARSTPDEDVSFDAAVTTFIPTAHRTDGCFVLDAETMGRRGCEFALQDRKIRVHHLFGTPGRTFIDAVASDFQRLVSERRAFLDPTVLAADTFRHLIRTGKEEGSRLRVFRDADRARLERFALGTSLQSLERISSLIDASEAREQVRGVLAEVIRVLDGEDDWPASMDVVFRLLRLAISTEDTESVGELIARTDLIWGTTDALKENLRKLYHRGRPIDSERCWVWLRNYLHEKRLETIADAVPATLTRAQMAKAAPHGLRRGTKTCGADAVLHLARLLAASDLRMRDREDDQYSRNPKDSRAPEWMRGLILDSPDLATRFDRVGAFVSRLRDQDDAWGISPARLFLCTRPPSYFDIARRFLQGIEKDGFPDRIFDDLLDAVNAIRGTQYVDPVGRVVDKHTVAIPGVGDAQLDEELNVVEPRLILGNLVTKEDPHWIGVTRGRPVLSKSRLHDLSTVLAKAEHAATHRTKHGGIPASLLVLPELSLPRSWFRTVATHVVKQNALGLVVGLEYDLDRSARTVESQVHAVLPRPHSGAATWSWTKGFPSREEAAELAAASLRFPPPPPRASRPRRTVVRSSFGDFSVLICSELLEADRVADLLGRVEVVLAPSWNTDTASYDHLIRSVGMHLNAIVAVANCGHYSDCRAWAPKAIPWQRDLCRLIERDVNSVVTVELPLASLRAFRAAPRLLAKPEWKPLPPEWPSRG